MDKNPIGSETAGLSETPPSEAAGPAAPPDDGVRPGSEAVEPPREEAPPISQSQAVPPADDGMRPGSEAVEPSREEPPPTSQSQATPPADDGARPGSEAFGPPREEAPPTSRSQAAPPVDDGVRPGSEAIEPPHEEPANSPPQAASTYDDAIRFNRRRAGRMLFAGLVGIMVAGLVAQWSAFRVEAIAPLVDRKSSEVDTDSVTGLYWFADSRGVAVGSARARAVTAASDGSLLAAREPNQVARDLLGSVGGREILQPALNALSRMPADDGTLHTRIESADLQTPGGLIVVESNGFLLTTGAASIRRPGDTAARNFDVKGDQNSVWQLDQIQRGGRSRGFSLVDRRAPVTALAYIPGAKLVAVGALDGSLRLISTLSPSLIRGTEAPADDLAAAVLQSDIQSHPAAVVALAPASSAAVAIDGADIASAASDNSIRAWQVGRARQLMSLDIAFSGSPPAAFGMQDGLQLSPSGETLLARSAGGDVYVARLVDDRLPDRQLAASSSSNPVSTLEPASAYVVQIVVRTDGRLSVATAQRELEGLRTAINLFRPPASGSAEPLFEDDMLRKAAEAIGNRQPILIAATRTIDEQTARSLRTLGSPILSLLPSPLRLRPVDLAVDTTAATLSSDGRRLFAAGTDCLIREVDLDPLFASPPDAAVTPGVLTTLSGHGGLVTDLALSPDGDFLAATSLDQRVRIHRLASARRVSALPFAGLTTGPPCPSSDAVDPVAVVNESPPTATQQAAVPNNQPVLVQFAGTMQREQMVSFAQGLRSAGWNVQGADKGGERTTAAIGLNVVRYGSQADQATAARLAKQASASSPARRTLRVEYSPKVAPNTLEVWISDANAKQSKIAPSVQGGKL